jgi:hypothetical protein
MIITVTYIDGTTEEFESNKPTIGDGLFQIEDGDVNIYIPLTSIKNIKVRLTT